MVADLFDIVNQVDKYQARLRRADAVTHPLYVAAAKFYLHSVEVIFVNQGQFGFLFVVIFQSCDDIIAALKDNDMEAVKSALAHEDNLNRMQIEFRRSHVERMGEGICSPQTGLIFIDLVDNIEKCGDHLTNIAQAIIGGLQWEGVKPKLSNDS